MFHIIMSSLRSREGIPQALEKVHVGTPVGLGVRRENTHISCILDAMVTGGESIWGEPFGDEIKSNLTHSGQCGSGSHSWLSWELAGSLWHAWQ